MRMLASNCNHKHNQTSNVLQLNLSLAWRKAEKPSVDFLPTHFEANSDGSYL